MLHSEPLFIGKRMGERHVPDDKDRQDMLNWLSPAPWQLRQGGDRKGGSLVERILAARGYDSPEAAASLFQLSLEDLPDPFLFRDMDRAVKIILSCLDKANPRILIFGDYDADGLTAAALLSRYFEELGHLPLILIPDRFDDGYGLSPALVAEIGLHRPDLVITVDTGTSAPASIGELLDQGIDVVVTDHHQATGGQEDMRAPLINPSLSDEPYPFKNLSGAGVALMLTLALDKRLGRVSSLRDQLITLATVGTVADVVSLTGANRIIVRHGLEHFARSAPEGLRAICRSSSADMRRLDTRDIAFSVAPRLNAAGRMGDVRLALDLLLENNPVRAEELVAALDSLNQERRQAEQEVFGQALDSVLEEAGDEPLAVALAAGSGWHVGVLGIVSSRLVERLRVPAITLNEEDGILTGSARSYGRINLLAAIRSAGHLLEKYGGHSGAAGLTIRKENLEAFRKAVDRHLRAIPPGERQSPHLADVLMDGRDLTVDTIMGLEVFEPTGAGFERPLVWMEDLTIENVSRVGEGRHLKFTLRTSDESMQTADALLFGRGEDIVFFAPGDLVDVMAYPEINAWRDRRTVQLRLLDIRPAHEDRVNEMALSACQAVLEDRPPGRLPHLNLTPAFFSALWPLADALSGPGARSVNFHPVRLAWLLSHRYNVEAGALAVLLGLSVFDQAGLLSLVRNEDQSLAFRASRERRERPALSDTALWGRLKAMGAIQT